MKYLLSSGHATSDPIEYIRDLIRINLLIRLDEVPYWTGGSENLITEVATADVEEGVRSIVSGILGSIRSKFKSIQLDLSSVEIVGSRVRLNIKLGEITEIYDIERGN